MLAEGEASITRQPEKAIKRPRLAFLAGFKNRRMAGCAKIIQHLTYQCCCQRQTEIKLNEWGSMSCSHCVFIQLIGARNVQ